jgi:hypothetical protein
MYKTTKIIEEFTAETKTHSLYPGAHQNMYNASFPHTTLPRPTLPRPTLPRPTLPRPTLHHNNTEQVLPEQHKLNIYIIELDKFMVDLKQYMKDNNLDEDKFMKNLCDDIYVCTKGLYSNKGMMYVTGRATSQGKERSYNLRNLDDLGGDIPNVGIFRGLSNHTMSQEQTTTYASVGAAKMMRTVSEGI